MILQFLRLGLEVDLSGGKASVLEAHSPLVYTRICQSLISGEEERAAEPYCLWDDRGRKSNPKKSLLILSSLPKLPYDNRTLLTKLAAHAAKELELSSHTLEAINSEGIELLMKVEESLGGMAGEYEFTIDWTVETFLKAFGLSLACLRGEPFVDTCMRFFGMCSDIGLEMTLVMMGGKSFFESQELQQLYDTAVFLGIPLLLVERYHDASVFDNETKTIIDQDFVVN